ncbi:MAG: ChaN family lipoprotein [Emcibacter sp.]|nr:ChaN family lipoprotein [Emcibacter sp.]
MANQKYISQSALLDRLGQSQNILLGIRPDNIRHHELAAKVIENLDKTGLKPVILLGNVEHDKQNAFAIFNQRHQNSSLEHDATGLDMLLDWSKSGQSNWAIVRPVFDMAMLRQLSLRAGLFSRYEIGQIYRNGLDGLPQNMADRLRPLLIRPLSDKIRIALNKQTRAEHCGKMPPEIIKKFTTLTRAQNSLFALKMATEGARTQILIASERNILKDIGVPRILDSLMGPDKTISLLFLETGQDMPKGKVDYIWHTAARTRLDPCAFLISK